MQLLTLSRHAEEQVSAAAQRRQSEYDANIAGYLQLIEQRGEGERIAAGRSVWSERKYAAWVRFQLSRLLPAMSAMPSPPRKAQASNEEAVWQAGSEGEQRVTHALADRLSEDWVAIAGYKNPGGEVDLLLVGPPGVMAVEIKCLNGEIHCDGDHWWRDKYDKHANLVEQAIPIADRGGRGPSAQVNAATDRLQRVLSERTSIRSVLQAVVFLHEASRLGVLQRVTVDAVALAQSFDVPTLIRRARSDRTRFVASSAFVSAPGCGVRKQRRRLLRSLGAAVKV